MDGNVTRATVALGMERSNLHRKIRTLGIRPKRSRASLSGHRTELRRAPLANTAISRAGTV